MSRGNRCVISDQKFRICGDEHAVCYVQFILVVCTLCIEYFHVVQICKAPRIMLMYFMLILNGSSSHHGVSVIIIYFLQFHVHSIIAKYMYTRE